MLSVQSIEHVPDPERVLAEVARVLRPDGVAVFVTPNRLTLGRPDEIIDPYHHVEFDAAELRALCAPWFGDVAVRGLFGSPRYMDALRRGARARSTGSSGSTRSGSGGAVPNRARRRLYDLLLRRCRNADDPRAAAIVPEDFELRDDGLEAALDVVADLHGPDRAVTRDCVWCGAPRSTGPPSACAAGSAARPAAPRRPIRGPSGDELAPPTATGTGRPAGAASASWATRCCAARAAISPAGSTRSRRPARCSTWAPATARCIDALARQGREAVGLEREAGRA